MSYIVENAGVIGFTFFFTIFIIIFVKTYLLTKKETFNEFANIPFKEDADGAE